MLAWSPEGVRRGPAAPELRSVNDVVVQERSRVDVFHDAPQEIFGIVFPVPAEPRGKQMQHGTEALAARAEDVFAHLLNERNVGAQALMDPALHAFHIGPVLFKTS